MNLKQLCQDLLVKKYNSSDVLVCEFREKKHFPYGSIHVQFRRRGIKETCLFLTKYPNMKENAEQLNLFQRSHFKENIARIILQELEELFNVSFTTEIYFSSQELIVYNVEPKIFLRLDYSEKQFEVGLSTLAKFHATGAAYINSKSKAYNIDEIEILEENPLSEKNFKEIYSLISKYLKDIKEIHPNTFLDYISLPDIEREVNIISRKLEKLHECKKLLINGHYRYQNLAFNATNTECKISDFSCVAYQSPLFDVFQFISSFSSKSNWRSNCQGAKMLYYDLLRNEMEKLNIAISVAFSKEEYEETFKLMLPVMEIMFYLETINEKFQPKLIADSDISCLHSSYFGISKILNVLNLKPNSESQSVVSFEDCYLVFKQTKMEEFKLYSFQTKPQQGRNGFLGEHHDMIVEIGNQKKHIRKNFFVKAVPQSEALQEFAKSVGSFFKETMFYSRYVPLLKEYGIDLLDKIVPECYYADEHKYIILENLKSHGYTTLSPRLETSNEVVLAVIEVLATLNASCIVLEELIERKIGYKYRLSDQFQQEFNEAFYSSEPVVESHRNSGKGGMEALNELIDFDDGMDRLSFKTVESCDEQVSFARPSIEWRNTLCHGDFWTKNYMIKFEGNQVKNVMTIDFQTYRYAPPAQDLMAFIYLNTSKELRQRFMNNWMDFYYEVFAEKLQIYSINIDDILSRGDFDESCRFYKQFAITQSITHFQIILVPPEIIDPLLQDQARAREIFLGSRYDLVRMVWPMDETYRRRLTESVVELGKCLMTKII